MKYLCLILLATSVTGRFTDDFYQRLAKDNANKNLISSPLSVEIVMSMAYMGSGGKTAQEMRDVLKLPADKKEVARKHKASIIIKWVKEQTRDRIESIADEKDMTDDFAAVLLNAIYFKGQWQKQFNSSNTKKADFRTADNKLVPVQMMSQLGKFKAA